MLEGSDGEVESRMGTLGREGAMMTCLVEGGDGLKAGCWGLPGSIEAGRTERRDLTRRWRSPGLISSFLQIFSRYFLQTSKANK